MADTISTEVLICGAGGAGLTLAIDLARRDIDFELIDKISAPFPGSRGKGIQPRSQEVYEDLGVLDRLRALGGPYPLMRTYRDGTHGDTPFVATRPPSPAEPYCEPLMVPQFLTEGALRERLAELGHRPEYGCELVGFNQDDAAVHARIRTATGARNVHARFVVGTDGGHSFVRGALGTGFPGEALAGRRVIADLKLTGLSRDIWHNWNPGHPLLQLSLCPLAGTSLFQLHGPLADEGDVDLSASGVETLIRERTGRSDVFVQAISWASDYRMSARVADHYRTGRVFLAGDAAHVHPSTGAQGLNTSVQDAYNLGWKIAAVLRGAPESLLDTYEAERRPIALGMVELSLGFLRSNTERGEMRRGPEAHQLELGYFDSPLAIDRRLGPAGPRAGARAPDALCRNAAGKQIRLFDLFRGPHWTMITVETDVADWSNIPAEVHVSTIGPHGDIQDCEGSVTEGYGLAPGERVLIRPDGYIGAIVPAADQTTIDDYFAQVLP